MHCKYWKSIMHVTYTIDFSTIDFSTNSINWNTAIIYVTIYLHLLGIKKILRLNLSYCKNKLFNFEQSCENVTINFMFWFAIAYLLWTTRQKYNLYFNINFILSCVQRFEKFYFSRSFEWITKKSEEGIEGCLDLILWVYVKGESWKSDFFRSEYRSTLWRDSIARIHSQALYLRLP